MQTIIEIKNLSLSIQNKQILENISLQVFEKDYLSIIGPNGAGKTSLLKCLMRIYTGYQGSIFFRGKSIQKISQKKLAQQVSYVPQHNGTTFPFTVEEFVLMGRYPYLSPFTSFGPDDMKIVREALALTKIDHLSSRHIQTLSGGERQRVYIAAALVQGAGIMLLDEPTTFLDPGHEKEVYNILKKLNRDMGLTILSVTHDINNAVLQSDKIVILKQGKVMFFGTAEDVMQNKILQQAYRKEFIFIKHPVTGQKIIAPEVPLQ